MPKPFYLIGFQRSGSTLLSDLLDQHSQIRCLDEPEISKYLIFNDEAGLSAKQGSIPHIAAHYGVSLAAYQELLQKYRQGQFSNKELLSKFYALFNQKSAARIGAKEVCDIKSMRRGYLRKLLKLQPDADFVFIERELEGIVHSFHKMGFYPPDRRPLTQRNMISFAEECWYTVRQAKKDLAKANTLFLSFADLVDRPKEVLAKAFRFLQVDDGPQEIERIIHSSVNGLHQNYVGLDASVASAWRKRLSDDQIKRLASIGGRTTSLKWFFQHRLISWVRKCRQFASIKP